MKKLLVVGIIVLFLGMTISSTTGIYLEKQSIKPMSFSNTLYVGGNGPNNYTKIQDAINDSEDGDTVFVFDDSSPYYERVKINNSISLMGEDRNTTVIDANRSGNVIFITSDEVGIHEFTIQNSNISGIEIDIYFGFCTISDNIIIDNVKGIYMRYSCNNTIEDNTFFDNEHYGLDMLSHCNNNTISGNTIEHSPVTYPRSGIYLYKCTGNNISGNTIKDNDDGIFFHSSDYNLVLNNIITSNEYSGIELYLGSNNNVIENNISYNLHYGIHIYPVDSKNNIIYHNNLVYNYQNAYDDGNNTWDDGKYGNYWSDYEGKYPDAKKKRREGIWDTPYEISGGDNRDMCPLIKQWPEPFSRALQNNEYVWFLRWFEWFPNAFPILRYLLGLL